MLCRCTCLLLALCATSCREQRQPEPSPIFSKESAPDDTVQHYDLPDIQEATLLIGGTLSGPDTYYEYRGQGMGRQFRLAEEFARSIGVRLQMDIAPDTATLRQRLASGDIDFIALDMPKWSTRRDAPELASAISEWWTGGARDAVLRSLQSTPRVTRRHMRPVMKDRARGIISPYDDLLMRHSRQIRWDWRLLAALCYQESGFDPQAVSWAGARGLMQIMPGTATQLGIHQGNIHDPETNISAGTRYLSMLNRLFSDIPGGTHLLRAGRLQRRSQPCEGRHGTHGQARRQPSGVGARCALRPAPLRPQVLPRPSGALRLYARFGDERICAPHHGAMDRLPPGGPTLSRRQPPCSRQEGLALQPSSHSGKEPRGMGSRGYSVAKGHP